MGAALNYYNITLIPDIVVEDLHPFCDLIQLLVYPYYILNHSLLDWKYYATAQYTLKNKQQ